MRITVDMERCESNGVCVGLAPEVFDIDDEMVLHVVDPAPRDPAVRARVREAVLLCPVLAITASDE